MIAGVATCNFITKLRGKKKHLKKSRLLTGYEKVIKWFTFLLKLF